MNITMLIHKLTGFAVILLSVVMLSPGIASAQFFPDSLYQIIYGNKDGSPIIGHIGETIEIPVWGITPTGDYRDSVTTMCNPLATNDSIISERLGGYFPDTLVGTWDWHLFFAPGPDNSLSGWTNQTMLGIAWLMGPEDPQNYFWTDGDTVLICTFVMRIGWDTSLIGNTVNPFRSGADPQNGGLLWGDGLWEITPVATFSPLYFPICCPYVSGDINGDGISNGVDIVYGVNYLKRTGPNPLMDCNPASPNPFYAAGDVNGNCAFNGIDITYYVRYLKGQVPSLLYCESSPPCNADINHYDIRGDCLSQKSALQDSGYMVLEVIGNDLHIHHMDAFYQCCLLYFVDYRIVGNDITAVEQDYGNPCYCDCLFNLESILYSLEPNLYTVRLIGIYGDTVGVDTVRVNGY